MSKKVRVNKWALPLLAVVSGAIVSGFSVWFVMNERIENIKAENTINDISGHWGEQCPFIAKQLIDDESNILNGLRGLPGIKDVKVKLEDGKKVLKLWHGEGATSLQLDCS